MMMKATTPRIKRTATAMPTPRPVFAPTERPVGEALSLGAAAEELADAEDGPVEADIDVDVDEVPMLEDVVELDDDDAERPMMVTVLAKGVDIAIVDAVPTLARAAFSQSIENWLTVAFE